MGFQTELHTLKVLILIIVILVDLTDAFQYKWYLGRLINNSEYLNLKSPFISKIEKVEELASLFQVKVG